MAPITVDGYVMDARAHWTADESRIVTEATVHTPDGDVVVSQLGGTVDGVTMRQFPGPEHLALGMRVSVLAHADTDLDDRPHTVVDDVRVMEEPAGYVRTGPTKAGNSLYWESGCIFVTIDSAGTKELPGDTEFPLIDQAIDVWNSASATCSFIDVKSSGKASREVGKDYTNVIKFRDASWCRPKIKDDPARCYGEAAAGITNVVYVDDATSDRDGAILDADIEINGVNFAISNGGVTLGTAPCKAELLNTLIHELGHLHGLEHTCRVADDPARVDNKGNAVPFCTATADPKIVEATMYPYQECGETKKETLETDDTQILCDVYPKAEDPGTCAKVSPSTPGCCSASDDGLPYPAVLLAGITGVLLGRRRSRSRR